MKNNRKIALLIATVFLLSTFLCVLPGCGTNANKAFFDAIDTDYAYDLAIDIIEGEDTNDSEIGGRTAGSDAEHATADLLMGEMEKLGLEDVEKIPVPVDKWQFNGASLTLDGESDPIVLNSYATAATPKGGIDAEIIDLGTGTNGEYEGINAKGKIVLVDIDMLNEWWISYPMLEAEYKGAAAILICSVAGYVEIAEDAMNNNAICGPTSIPTLNITVKDAKKLKKKLKGGKVTGHLEVDNIVEPKGTSYNLFGRIKGKDSSEAIAFGAHYDAYFDGFQDDTIAATGVLALAKAFKESGYTPQRDIWFILHGAEEWGSSGSQFDWCKGSWELITNKHPEWAGKLLTFFNFELPAYEFADYTYAATATELFSFAGDFADSPDAPKPKKVFKEGVLTDGYPSYTYSDDFPYLIAGVPTVINGFFFQDNQEEAYPFYTEIYHSQYDNKDTYNEDVFRFNLEYYGAMGIDVDKTPALKLDYTAQAGRLKDALGADIAEACGIDTKAYLAAIDNYEKAAKSVNEKVSDINDRYLAAMEEEANQSEIDAIWQEAKEFNKKNLALFKQTQDCLLGLLYDRPIVPHEAPQENIGLIDETLASLDKGDAETAWEEYAIAINGWNAYYPSFFSKKVCDDFYNMFYGKESLDKLNWGTDRKFPWANVDDTVRSMYAKIEAGSSDFSKEIKAFKAARDDQNSHYKKLIKEETSNITKLADKMSAL